MWNTPIHHTTSDISHTHSHSQMSHSLCTETQTAVLVWMVSVISIIVVSMDDKTIIVIFSFKKVIFFK